ncbi:MAG: exopolyphosphatase-like protein [candidate division Kazan bacterium GW2011_GWA1_50_15]|uniref:Exopolyphosphatase-like protein n=2 Tax=Bacteria division Kazan-3B-28 TaxID=1798534 RepID=A0A0G4BAN1_UNCK3|nr:MAG: exopolyphosphatase-like protein [candidate division Kazan bacterium GW2011_GWA1_50_15]
MLGLYGVLSREFHMEVGLAADGDVPQAYAYLPYFFRISDGFDPLKFDTVVILDCGSWARTGFFDDVELNIAWPERLIVIDHHAVQRLTPGLHLVDSTASSTSEIIWRLIQAWRVPVTKEVATCLLTGISFDTGSFQHDNTRIATLQAAAGMMEAGASLNKIVSGIYLGKSVARLKLWGKVLGRLKYDHGRKLSVSMVTQADLKECGAGPDDIEGLVNLMNTVPGTKFTLLLSEEKEGRLKGSFRTEDDAVDVAKLAKLLGGGGHKKAAGFAVPAELVMDGQVWKVL